MSVTSNQTEKRKRYTTRTIWGFAKSPELSLSEDELYALIYRETGKEHMSDMAQWEVDAVVRALAALKSGVVYREPQNIKRYDIGGNPKTIPMRRKIYMLTTELNWQNDISRINGFCKRMYGVDRVEWLSVAQCSNVIEGLKKMIERQEAEK